MIKRHLVWQAKAKAKATRARDFAVHAHGCQRYGDRPYVEHLTEVVGVLTDFGFSGSYLCAGWLHDVVEDTDTTLAAIRRHFGQEVAQLVDAVSGGGERASHTASIYKKIAAHPAAAVLKLADRIRIFSLPSNSL